MFDVMKCINYAEVEKTLVAFVAYEFKKAGFSKACIGLSGGIDSALVSAIAVKALGAENVMGILMPYSKIKGSSSEDVVDAINIANHLKMPYIVKNITDVVDTQCSLMNINYRNMTPESALRRGNVCARVRMMTLFDHSSEHKALVLGTENFTESSGWHGDKKKADGYGTLGFGYYTLWGDQASCIEPIYDLYKTQVFGLAMHMGLPKFVIDKKPSARLYDDHEDEKELGITYKEADEILYLRNNKNLTIDEIVKEGYSRESVELVHKLIYKNAFKKNVPIYAPRVNFDKNIDDQKPRTPNSEVKVFENEEIFNTFTQ